MATLAREILAELEQRLHAHAGFDLPEWVVETRALARMSALELGPLAYLQLVSSPRGGAELHALVEAVRVGETRFFRHRPQVDALLEVVVPAWRSRATAAAPVIAPVVAPASVAAPASAGREGPSAMTRGSQGLARDAKVAFPRVWSAGCATGEEAYTLALVLSKALPRTVGVPAILATDVSAEAIAVARRGTYAASAIDDVPGPWLGGFVRDGDAVRVRPEVASLVTFKQQNLADEGVPRGFDLVWCRNVLIYFGPQARKKVLERLVGALNPGGFLFVGYSETLRDVPGLTALHHGDQVLWRKPSGDDAARAPVTLRSPVSDASPAKAAPSVKVAPVVKVAENLRSAAVPRKPAGVKHPATGRTTLRIVGGSAGALALEIRSALAAPGLATLTLDFDAADFLGDDVALVVKRAGAAAEAAGIELCLRATRPGPHRWLRRHGLAGSEE